MSLKAFHLVFIILSIILSFGFGAWGWITYQKSGILLDLIMTLSAFIVAVALIAYGRIFLRKMKGVSYL